LTVFSNFPIEIKPLVDMEDVYESKSVQKEKSDHKKKNAGKGTNLFFFPEFV
jgi:hypothetical protein